MYEIIHARPNDTAEIENLLDLCFGPDRFKKTAYKVRKNSEPIEELSLIALQGDEITASIKYWPLTVGGKEGAVLLGPIAVHPDHQGEGMGVGLIKKTMQMARDMGFKLVILVGDPEYYERFGYVSAFDNGLDLPGPVEAHRFLVAELQQGSLAAFEGMVAGVPASSHMSVAK